MSRLLRNGIVLGIVALSIPVLCSSARAAKRQIDFSYDRAERARTCPSGSVIQRKVAARLGYDPFASGAERLLSVEIRPSAENSGYIATIVVRSSDETKPGRRRLSTPKSNCADLVDALVFAVSVAIDPTQTLGGPSNSARPKNSAGSIIFATKQIIGSARTAAVAQMQDAAETTASAPQKQGSQTQTGPRTDKTISATSGLGVVFGTSPGATGLVSLGASMSWQHFGLHIGARATAPTDTSISTGSMRSFLYSGTVSGCGKRPPYFACGVFQLGLLHLRGIDLPEARSAEQLFTTAGLRLGRSFAITPHINFDLQIEFARNLSTVTARLGDRKVWQTPGFSGSLSGAVTWEL